MSLNTISAKDLIAAIEAGENNFSCYSIAGDLHLEGSVTLPEILNFDNCTFHGELRVENPAGLQEKLSIIGTRFLDRCRIIDTHVSIIDGYGIMAKRGVTISTGSSTEIVLREARLSALIIKGHAGHSLNLIDTSSSMTTIDEDAFRSIDRTGSRLGRQSPMSLGTLTLLEKQLC